MVKTILLIVAAAIAALLIYAAMQPDTFRFQRSTRIQAPTAKIQPLIADLHQFNTWNPFNKKDPAMKGSYRDGLGGPGSVYDFEGNKDVGKGSVELLPGASPGKVNMRLVMLEPFKVDNAIEFTLVPQGDATEVTWAMQGPSPFFAKLMHVVFNMDKMVGKDFEAGLSSLKAIAERS